MYKNILSWNIYCTPKSNCTDYVLKHNIKTFYKKEIKKEKEKKERTKKERKKITTTNKRKCYHVTFNSVCNSVCLNIQWYGVSFPYVSVDFISKCSVHQGNTRKKFKKIPCTQIKYTAKTWNILAFTQSLLT